MRIVVNKHCQVYLDFGRAGSLSLQLYCTYQNHRLLHVHVAVMLYLFIRKIELPLLSIFETTIYALKMSCIHCLYGLCKETCSSCWQSYYYKETLLGIGICLDVI